MYSGGCECKSVRYQFSGEPLTCYACHCTDCQTTSGSAFALSMIVNRADIEIIEGKPAANSLDYDGTEVQRHHCGQCGTALWFSADIYPDMAALKPGTFEDTSWFKPIAHIWVRSAQPWLILEDSTVKYEKQAGIAELMELWTKRENAS